MAKLYANENFPLPVVEELRRFGHDVVTTYESGRAGIAVPDDEVLAFSVSEKRVLLGHGSPHLFFGIDVTPMQEIADKVGQVYGQLQPPESDPMLTFDE